MGYTHYYKVEKEFDPEKFKKVVKDFKKVLPLFEQLGIDIAGGNGEGKPTITNKKIIFNGNRNCGHHKRDLGIAWPSEEAHGVSSSHKETPIGDKLEEITKGGVARTLVGDPREWVKNSDVDGAWFAGAKLTARTCGGDCSHETLALFQKLKPESYQEPQEDGKYFEFCKTAYKPYDVIVNVVLIIAKHHLGGAITISSDGQSKDWDDGRFITQKILGYGADFKLDGDDE